MSFRVFGWLEFIWQRYLISSQHPHCPLAYSPDHDHGDVVGTGIDHAEGGFMTLTEVSIIVSIAVGVSGAVSGMLMYLDKRQTTKQSGLQTNGNFILTANQAIELANKRAFEAEKERDAADKEHQKELDTLNKKIEEIEARLKFVMGRMRFVISFDSMLDPENPTVEHVEIKHIADMRKEKREEIGKS